MMIYILAIILFLMLPIFVLLELIKRIIFLPIYPIAYLFRKWARFNYKFNNLTAKILWFALDDSINIEGIEKYGKDIEYCWYGKRCNWIEKIIPEGSFKEFMRSFYWGALRNSSVNLTEAISAGNIILVLKRIGNNVNYFEVRKYNKIILPYLELHPFGFMLQAGFLKNGRFESEFTKRTIEAS
jgi:hypothetical protein